MATEIDILSIYQGGLCGNIRKSTGGSKWCSSNKCADCVLNVDSDMPVTKDDIVKLLNKFDITVVSKHE